MDKKQVKKPKAETEKPVEINEKEEFKRIAEGIEKVIKILERLENRLNGGFK